MLSRKGQQDVLSAVMLTGIMVVIVGSVYFWGIPLVQKNRDVNALQNSEDFMRTLSDKIKFVANNAGRDQISVNVPVVISFDHDVDIIRLAIETEGSIYATGANIPLSRTGKETCGFKTDIIGIWGMDQPEVLCVETTKLAENAYKSIYTLKYIKLERKITEATSKIHKIDLTGTDGSIGQDHSIVMEYVGSSTGVDGVLNTEVKITLL